MAKATREETALRRWAKKHGLRVTVFLDGWVKLTDTHPAGAWSDQWHSFTAAWLWANEEERGRQAEGGPYLWETYRKNGPSLRRERLAPRDNPRKVKQAQPPQAAQVEPQPAPVDFSMITSGSYCVARVNPDGMVVVLGITSLPSYAEGLADYINTRHAGSAGRNPAEVWRLDSLAAPGQLFVQDE